MTKNENSCNLVNTVINDFYTKNPDMLLENKLDIHLSFWRRMLVRLAFKGIKKKSTK